LMKMSDENKDLSLGAVQGRWMIPSRMNFYYNVGKMWGIKIRTFSRNFILYMKVAKLNKKNLIDHKLPLRKICRVLFGWLVVCWGFLVWKILKIISSELYIFECFLKKSDLLFILP
jgi:hypothetical protein